MPPDLPPHSDENVDGLPHVREFSVVASVHHSRAA